MVYSKTDFYGVFKDWFLWCIQRLIAMVYSKTDLIVYSKTNFYGVFKD